MAAQMEVERLANFQVECVGMISSRTHGKRTRNWVNASEYSIGVFLAEEVVPQSRRGAKLPQRDRRVFLRAAVYHKEFLLAGVEAPNGGHKRTPSSGSVSIDLDSLADHKWTSVHDDSVLADVLGSLELAVGQHGTAWNHVYINMVGTTVEDLPRIEAASRASSTSPSRTSGASRFPASRFASVAARSWRSTPLVSSSR